jgi:hypothetical protein
MDFERWMAEWQPRANGRSHSMVRADDEEIQKHAVRIIFDRHACPQVVRYESRGLQVNETSQMLNMFIASLLQRHGLKHGWSNVEIAQRKCAIMDPFVEN